MGLRMSDDEVIVTVSQSCAQKEIYMHIRECMREACEPRKQTKMAVTHRFGISRANLQAPCVPVTRWD